jgi:hypothetical protein
LCADDVRASLVCAALRQATPEAWGGAHSFAVCRGASTANSDEPRYLKSVVLHQWLFGVELPGARTQRCGTRQRCTARKSRRNPDAELARRAAPSSVARRHGAAVHARRAARADEPQEGCASTALRMLPCVCVFVST